MSLDQEGTMSWGIMYTRKSNLLMSRNLKHEGIKMGGFRAQRIAMGAKEIDTSVSEGLTTQAQGP